MSPSRRAKGRKRAPRERSRDRIAPPTPTRVGGRRSARERLIALAPLLILLALLLYLSTGPDRGAIRNVFGIFFLAWGLFLIVRAGLRLRPRPAQIQRPPAGTTAEAQTVD
ncbi:MAG TPA: hypothetical protein VHL09_03370, partial [Dehalococcoidia bacterium]|nr:hypothetical protein [Dehalococcoidia bacterium]